MGVPADVAEVGPLRKVPNLIGLCCRHGWWFEAEREEEPCPEPGCPATVFFYRRGGGYTPPEGTSEEIS